jgi:hypothetical protein
MKGIIFVVISQFFLMPTFYAQPIINVKVAKVEGVETILNVAENPTIDPANYWIVDFVDEIVLFKEIRIFTFSAKDTLLNGKLYKEMKYSNKANPDNYISTKEFYRQDGKKVWRYNGEYDILIADFGLNTGDTLVMENPHFVSKPLVIAARDTVILADSKPRIRLRYYCGNEEGMEVPHESQWISLIEGLGADSQVFGQLLSCSLIDNLWYRTIRCYFENNKLVYKASHIDDCLISSTTYSTVNNLKVYPNPGFDKVRIDSEYEIDHIRIFDIHGQTVMMNFILANGQIDVNSLPQGVYFIMVTTIDRDVTVVKFVKI